jgi:choline-sulfatase
MIETMTSPKLASRLSRRDLLKAGLGTAALALVSKTGARAESKADRPNILFLMADQHRGDCLSSAGHPAVRTPHMDRLAVEGVRFRCAYSSTPTCTPARSAILTGLSPWRHGMLGYGKVAEKYPSEMPRALRDAGYYTLGIGKMHWTPQRCLHGFHQTILDESSRVQSPDFRSDYRAWFYSQAPNLDPDATGLTFNDYRSKAFVLPEELHPTHWTGQTAVNFIERYDREEPFFLKVSFARPHSPYDPPERWMKACEGASIPDASVGKWAEKYAPRSDDTNNIWHGSMGPEQVHRSRQGYYGSVAFVDEQIGRILEVLDRRGLTERTLIVYTSDHGDMTGDHHLWRKSYAYEPSARIPMLLRWPDGLASGPRGVVMDQPVELRDLLPTFLDAASATSPIELDGKSMLALARGETSGWRPYIDLEHDICYGPENHWSALTDGHSKFIFHARSGEEQFFDLDHDPMELNDLAGDPAAKDRVGLWRERLIEHLAPRGETFVSGGKLTLRPTSTLYSPNYPGPQKSNG